MRLTGARRVAIGATLVLAAGVAITLAADPLAAWGTRKALRSLDGYRFELGSVDVRLRDLTYVVRGLHVVSDAAGAPLAGVDVERAEVTLEPRALLSGDLVARVHLEAPVVRLVERDGGRGRPRRVRAVGIPDAAPAALVERLEVRDGEVVWTDATSDERATLRIHGVEGTVVNFATDGAVAPPGDTSLEVRARLQESGTLRASLHGDPVAERLTFDGTATLEGLKLTDIAALIEARSAFEPEAGSFHATVDVHAENGDITGDVRPIVEAPTLSGEGDGIVGAIKGSAAEAVTDWYSGEAKGVDDPAIVTSAPIRGTVDGASRPIPTFLAIVATALGRGLSDALAVPPGGEPITVESARDAPP